MRGLSTVRSFLNVHKENPEIIKELISAGLYRVGFGIDGSTYKVYKLTHKPQSVEDCLNAIRILIEFYNLEPETLMVFGHNEKEDKIALEKAFYFSLEMFKKYGALPRPHVSKDIVPGNDGWNHKNNKDTIKKYIENPWLFQNMDFTAIPSNLTHPNEEFRDLVTEVYLKICNLPYTLTQYVRPYDSYPNSDLIRFNCEKYDI
ncbi:hypothetical protein BMS3Bbin03_00027 [bacterium BMS3Bbin03]|nr:hypothetical protein BMS3Bbin03_00027 [bacterium BMS3Bbin03]